MTPDQVNQLTKHKLRDALALLNSISAEYAVVCPVTGETHGELMAVKKKPKSNRGETTKALRLIFDLKSLGYIEAIPRLKPGSSWTCEVPRQCPSFGRAVNTIRAKCHRMGVSGRGTFKVAVLPRQRLVDVTRTS